jgi:hypothetical protein
MRHGNTVEEISQFPSRVFVDARGAAIENAEQCALCQPRFLRDVGCDLVVPCRKAQCNAILADQ